MPRLNEITLPDEFASTMQQLVAEAEKSIAPGSGDDHPAQSEAVQKEFAALNARLDALENKIASGFENLDNGGGVSEQLEQLDAQMVALRNSETVNHRLFNSLHEELKNYRDNFLRESLQKPFLRDLVMLYDDLSSIAAQMQSGDSSGRGAIKQWSANLENALHSLIEILHRMEVSEIEPKDTVDRSLHRVISFEPAEFAEDDGRIVMRVKRGFIWRNQVLRPEEVVAKRFS